VIPEIFSVGFFKVNSFGLLVALSIAVAFITLKRSFIKYSIDPNLAEKFVLAGGVGGIIGARIWYIFEDWEHVKNDLFGAILSGAGFTFYGGFILVSFVIWTMTKIYKIPLHSFLDSVGPTLCLGYAVGRLGCQLSGDGDYGVATNSIWGMSYERGVVPTPPGVLVFPTPLYESALSLLIFALLIKIENSRMLKAPYSRFGLYLTLMSLERLFVEFLRVNPMLAYGLSQAQIVSLVLCLLGLLMMIQIKRTANLTNNDF
jgi:phosphatidylglycerol---prolipoprotein diacylglyceryl transferase